MLNTQYKSTFVFTIATSALVYLLVYILLTHQYQPLFAVCSLVLGAGIYLLERKIYKTNQEHDRLLAKAYRLIIWLVPLALLAIAIVAFYTSAFVKPEFHEFYSFEQLQWSGPFVFAFWPILNLFILLANCAVFFWLAVYYLGLPLVSIVLISVLAALVLVYKKLRQLKNDAIMDFSLARATVHALAPLLGFGVIVVIWL